MPLIELSYPPTRNIGKPAHNVPVTLAVETGLFGVLLWLITPCGALWMAWRRRAALSVGGLAASAALMALLVVAQLDHYLWAQPIGSLIWWLAVTLAALWSINTPAKHT
jgi:O-antigen ligase